jgi:hypothetical protein
VDVADSSRICFSTHWISNIGWGNVIKYLFMQAMEKDVQQMLDAKSEAGWELMQIDMAYNPIYETYRMLFKKNTSALARWGAEDPAETHG